MDKPYEPEVDDYVVWERESWTGIMRDEGWVYFKADPIPEKKGFPSHSRYITIETSVKDKPKEQLEGSMVKHRKIHTLLLCYERDWKDLKFIRKRESKVIQHYSQYDDRSGEVL
tara:strand:+ start:539 stop:880 length:342 start_codon:yes stop_codon:yes gene_type:complete